MNNNWSELKSRICYSRNLKSFKAITHNVYNFGPQHPAAHGVLRVILHLIQGETIRKTDPHIGLIHRGTEKLMENRTYIQSIPFMDRLDYVSPITQEHTYVLAIEHILNLKVPLQAQILRMFYIEITRLINHIMSITTHALDIGALTPFLWGFDEREKFMEIYEKTTGSRLHAIYVRPGGISKTLSKRTLIEFKKIMLQHRSRIEELEGLLSKSSIWRIRTEGIGLTNQSLAVEFGFSGVMLRSTGLPWDLRKTTPYEQYSKYNFKVPICFSGDSYGRYYLRIQEMKESLNIIDQLLTGIISNNEKPIKFTVKFTNKITTGYRKNIKTSMEAIIQHFKYYMQGFSIQKNITYLATESPKGEFGIFLIADGSPIPFRARIRAPGFFHLSALNNLTQNIKMSDLVTVIGSIDIVFGEIDR